MFSLIFTKELSLDLFAVNQAVNYAKRALISLSAICYFLLLQSSAPNFNSNFNLGLGLVLVLLNPATQSPKHPPTKPTADQESMILTN